MKLISMTEYTLQTLDKDVTVGYGIRDKVRQIRAYAEFLKQPLNLGMFVPCDEEGNLMKSIHEMGFLGSQEMQYNLYKKAYDRAIKKVLFKNCFYDKASETVFYMIYEYPVFSPNHNGYHSNAEEIINAYPALEIELTETAKSQLN